MTKKEFRMKDILVYPYAFYGDTSMAKEVVEQAPADMIEENEQLETGTDGLAYAIGYRFEHYKGLDYFVLKLNACEEFVFEKFYAMNPGFNEELFNMLEAVRAFRFCDGKFDIDAVIGYDFNYHYIKYPGANTYRIYNVSPEPMSYEFNICCFYDKRKTIDELLERM